MDDFGYMPENKRGLENKCFECSAMTIGLHHVVPVSKGGTKVIPLCEGCHNLIHEGIISAKLIRDGLKKAKERGVVFGAPVKTTAHKAREVTKLRARGFTYKQIAVKTGISVGSVHKCLTFIKNNECYE